MDWSKFVVCIPSDGIDDDDDDNDDDDDDNVDTGLILDHTTVNTEYTYFNHVSVGSN
jgi:hypothetical protein